MFEIEYKPYLNVEQFKVWLDSLPDDQVILGASCQSCALAQYIHAVSLRNPEVTSPKFFVKTNDIQINTAVRIIIQYLLRQPLYKQLEQTKQVEEFSGDEELYYEKHENSEITKTFLHSLTLRPKTTEKKISVYTDEELDAFTVSMANTRPISRFESEQIEKAKVGIAEVIAKLRDLENK